MAGNSAKGRHLKALVGGEFRKNMDEKDPERVADLKTKCGCSDACAGAAPTAYDCLFDTPSTAALSTSAALSARSPITWSTQHLSTLPKLASTLLRMRQHSAMADPVPLCLLGLQEGR